MSLRQEKLLAEKAKQKWSEAYTLVGIALALGSWGYSVISPEPNLILGCLLLGGGVLALFAGFCRAFELKTALALSLLLPVLAGFGYFSYRILYVPHRDAEVKALLIRGYHIVDECSERPYNDITSTWMEDEQQRWVGETGSFIDGRMAAYYAQIWSGAKLIGLVKDTDKNGYRCTDMAAKVAALETVISEAYDPRIKHRDYNGPVYIFNAVNGKADISEAFKDGNAHPNIVVTNGDKDGNVTITGKVPPPKQP